MMVDKFSRELFLSSNSFQVYCKKKIMNVVRGQVGIDDEVKNWNYYCDEIRPVMFRQFSMSKTFYEYMPVANKQYIARQMQKKKDNQNRSTKKNKNKSVIDSKMVSQENSDIRETGQYIPDDSDHDSSNSKSNNEDIPTLIVPILLDPKTLSSKQKTSKAVSKKIIQKP